MDGCSEPDIPSIAPEDLIPTPAADEDEVRSPTPSLVHFVLGNFAFAMFLISLTIFIVFFAVAWLTILRDARSIGDQVLSNATGVSISLLQRVCFTNGHRRAAGINARPRPPTGPRCIRVIHFVDGPYLRSTHYL